MDRAYLRARLDRSFEEGYDVFPMISLTNSAENESRPGERDFDNLSGTVAHGLLVSRFFKRLTRKYCEVETCFIDSASNLKKKTTSSEKERFSFLCRAGRARENIGCTWSARLKRKRYRR